MNKLRELLRILPCRPSALQQFRGYVLEAVRLGEGKTAAQADEMIFLLRAQKHLLDLNLRYFPQSGMSEKEVIEATAKRKRKGIWAAGDAAVDPAAYKRQQKQQR